MKDTEDNRIQQTNWFTVPQHPLMEYKLFYAKVDTILFYVTARRGKTRDAINIEDGLDDVESIILRDPTEREDNSKEMFNKLVEKLDKKQ